MNEQVDPMEPVDPIIRAQLTRRSAGRLPEGLRSEVIAALASEPFLRVTRLPALNWRRPRLAAAGLAVALVAILAVGVAIPVLRPAPAASGLGSPAGYPAERALTTAELSEIMAEPALPINATLVATVTIQAHRDVCPMNRYPTLGVVAGMNSQVCVMGASLSVQIGGAGASGTYAFRYLGPGYLGYLGLITPAGSSRLAFHVSEFTNPDPLQSLPVGVAIEVNGKSALSPGFNPTPGAVSFQQPDATMAYTLLVSGYMTQLRSQATDATCSNPSSDPAGDPLDPKAADPLDPCVETWLADEPGPVPTRGADGALTFSQGAMSVDAAAEGVIDGIPGDVAVGGVFVVREYAGVYQVLAKVADVSILGTQPSASPESPTPEVPASPVVGPSGSPVISGPLAPSPVGVVGPGGRPLTADELTALWAGNPAGLAGRVAIVKGPIPYQCSGSGACLGTTEKLPAGIWAVKLYANGVLTPLGSLADTNTTPLPLAAAVSAMASRSNGLLLVDAWLDWTPSLACDTPPYPSDSLCGLGAVTAILTSSRVATQSMGNPFVGPQPSGVVWFMVGQGNYQVFGSNELNARPIHGIFLLSGSTIIARVAPETLP